MKCGAHFRTATCGCCTHDDFDLVYDLVVELGRRKANRDILGFQEPVDATNIPHNRLVKQGAHNDLVIGEHVLSRKLHLNVFFVVDEGEFLYDKVDEHVYQLRSRSSGSCCICEIQTSFEIPAGDSVFQDAFHRKLRQSLTTELGDQR